MSRAVAPGSGRVEWYDESLEALLPRRSIERSLPGAAAGAAALVSRSDLLDRRPVGVEAPRWRHPRLGTVLLAES
jgi:hypothetical protein